MKKFCPYCGEETEVIERSKTSNIDFKGHDVSYREVVSLCKNCNEVFASPKQMDANALSIRNGYQEQYDSLSPKEIKAIREKYNASQSSFSIILGLSEEKIELFENGTERPSYSDILLLKLASKKKIFYEMYKINSFKIGSIQRDNIEASKAF